MRYGENVSALLESPTWVDAPVLVLDPLLESQRMDDLRSLNLLDTEPEDRFDRITRLAVEFFRIPTAYVAFIEGNRQWFKSRVGICPSQTARDISFCQYTIMEDEPLIMTDTRQHPIGATHPFVVGKPHIRFYAGVPLSGPRGHKIGTFCLVGSEPRKFDDGDVAALVAFAALIEREINLGEIIQTQNELLSTRQKLLDAQKELDREFSDAAKYVQSMLPPPFSGDESIDWQFHPSARLGGDGLGYRRINEDQLAFYVLDVTGHGLGSGLLAVTALELLRNRNPASQINFGSPGAVVERLNRTFQMKDHNGKFLSVWYGVYSRSKRTITYANAGHPPALLLEHKDGAVQLTKTSPGGLVLGIMPDIHSLETTIDFPPGSELFLFTDGLYELLDPMGGRGSYDEFLAAIRRQMDDGASTWDSMLNWLTRARDQRLIDDDVTMMRFATKAEPKV
jgi:phosphoserine phosphatase RsbU/P